MPLDKAVLEPHMRDNWDGPLVSLVGLVATLAVSGE